MTAMVVSDLLRQRAAEHPDRLYLWCGDDRLTVADVDARSDRVAAGLAELGIAKGDRVAIIASNRTEALELFFACTKLGAIEVPLNVFLKGDFLAYQLDDSQASTLVVDEAGYAAATAVLDRLPALKRIVTLDPVSGDAPGAEVIPYERVRAGGAAVPAVDLEASDLLSIVYTSGTTGMPKGCMLPHGWYTGNAAASKEMLDYTEGDVVITALPLFHGWARGIVVASLLHGMTAVIEPTFSPAAMIERFVETGATIFAGVGMMGLALLGTPPSEADRENNLRVAFMFPITVEQQQAFEERFGTKVFSQLYGQTETGGVTFSRIRGPQNPASAGLASPSFEVRVVDDDDHEVPTGEVGEIVVRPKTPLALFLGYWRKPEATLEAWRNLWHHTGDYGRMDEDGFLYFVDRKSDALRRRGENVSSLQVEAAITAHPKVAEVAVHAVPSELGEDDIKACVVAAPEERPTPEELFDHFKEHLPYFAIPRYVELVDELPRNATMRVMKHVLRDRGVTEDTWDLEALGLTVAKAERR